MICHLFFADIRIMASNNKIKITFDPIIFLIFSFITVCAFLLQKFVPNLGINNIFTSPTSIKGDFPFSLKDPLSWCRVFLYVFGTKKIYMWIFLAIMNFRLPEIETNFGTGLTALMVLLSVLFSGVLFACFGNTSFAGSDPVIFLLIILDIMASIKKKTINLSSVFATIFIIVFFFTNMGSIKEGIIPFFICFAGGLCGSLVSFITVKKSSAKKKPVKKTKKNETEAKTVVYFDNEVDSPRFKNKNNSSSEDETVVGTLTF